MAKRTTKQIEEHANYELSMGWGKIPVAWSPLTDIMTALEAWVDDDPEVADLLDELQRWFERMHMNPRYMTEAERAWRVVRNEVRKNTTIRNMLLQRGVHPDDFIQDTFLLIMSNPKYDWTSQGADSYIKRRVKWNCDSVWKKTKMDKLIDTQKTVNEVSDHEDSEQ